MPDITGLIARFKSGSQSAYHSLFTAYFPSLVATARRHPGLSQTGLVDAEDIALSAFFGLWQEVADGRPVRDDLTDRDSLLRTLALLTNQKFRRARRDACRQKRDARRTVHATDLAVTAWEGLAELNQEPDRQALFREVFARAMGQLPSRARPVIELKLAGHTNPQISERLGISLRTVERVVSEVRAFWSERERLEGGPEA